MQERNLGRGGSSGSGYVPAQRNAPAPNLMTPVNDLFQPRRGLQLADGGVVGLLRNRSAAIELRRRLHALVGEDAPRAVATATVEHLDLRHHDGVHPRIGVLDVVPFVPLGDATIEE